MLLLVSQAQFKQRCDGGALPPSAPGNSFAIASST